MKKRKRRWMAIVGMIACLLLLSACAGNGSTATEDFVCTSSMDCHTLTAIGETLYALTQEKSGQVHLHAFDREKGTHEVLPVEVDSDEPFVSMQWQLYKLNTDGKKLYVMGANGSGGIYCIDSGTGAAQRKGFYPNVEITAWEFVDGIAYIGVKDAKGLGVYAIKANEFVLFAEMENPIAQFEDSTHRGEISCMDWVEDGLLMTLKVGDEPWHTVLLELKTGDASTVAQDVYSDRTAQNGKTLMMCERTQDGAQAVRIDENGQRQILKALDGIFRPIAAGNGFLMEKLGQDEARTVLFADALGNVQDVQLPEGAGALLGADARYAYCWDSASPDAESTLLMLDMETLEVVGSFK